MTTRKYKYHVFLSHNGAQKDWTRQLADRLRDDGLAVFFDEDSIQLGEDIPRAIERGLRSSRHVVLILSPEALDSEWVALEYTASLYKDPGAADRFLLPVMRNDCEVPLILGRLKYLDARGDDFDRYVQHLLNGIDRVEIEAPVEKRAVKSPKPQSNPFIVGMPVRSDDIYVERQADIAVREHLDESQLIVVTGPRRIGKTSLLQRSCDVAKSLGHPVARVDLQMFAGGTSMPQLYYFLAKELAKIGTEAPIDASEFLERPNAAFLTTLRRLPPKTLLTIDEFDALRGINGLDDFASVLRAFWMDRAFERQEISILIASGLGPEFYIQSAVVSPFNVGMHYRLDGFTRDEADKLFSQVALTKTDSDALHAFLGGHPFLLQVALHEIVEGTSLAALLDTPPKRNGPFGMYLESIEGAITSLLGKSIHAVDLSDLDRSALSQLAVLGVVRQVNGQFKYSCKMYEAYFSEQ